jgi:hypothetical protein
MNTRTAIPPRYKAETLSVSVGDPRLVNTAKLELENLSRKPARTADEKYARFCGILSSFSHRNLAFQAASP